MAGNFRRIVQATLNRVRLSAGTRSPLAQHVNRSQLELPRNLIRLGTSYGGWTIPRKPGLTEGSVCYLAGAGEDISFDCALASLFSCVVRIVDPTPRAIRHFNELKVAVKEGRRFPINGSDVDYYAISEPDLARLSFLPFGLAGADVEMRFYVPRNPSHVSCSTMNLQKTDEYFTAQCYRLSTLMESQRDSKIDLFKMDIEGGEYAVLADMLASNILPGMLLVEFDEVHSPLDSDARERVDQSINKLVGAGMRCIAVDGSNATFARVW